MFPANTSLDLKLERASLVAGSRGANIGLARSLSKLIAGIGLILTSTVWGKTNLTLTAFENGIDDGQTKVEQTALKISAMRVNIHVHGRVADVSIEASITSTADASDEGRFTLALPDDAVVMG